MRFRTRALMVLVALAAVALTVPGEVRNRRERRHLARIEAFYRRVAAIHDQERALCEANAGRRPYECERAAPMIGHWPRFADWAEEAAWHSGKSLECREAAAQAAREKDAVRRRLLLPVLRDIHTDAT